MAHRALIALLIGLFALGLAKNPAHAEPLPPRPTPEPTAVAVPAATAAPPEAPPEARGRITGTIIDRTTGAPAPGTLVLVGNATVTSDANGNYGLEMAAGEYLVSLVFPVGRGTPEQAPLSVTLAAGATVVQHLAFRSVPPAPQQVAPATPPATGSGEMPTQLPATGAGEFAWLMWVSLGAALCGGGLVLRRVRA